MTDEFPAVCEAVMMRLRCFVECRTVFLHRHTITAWRMELKKDILGCAISPPSGSYNLQVYKTFRPYWRRTHLNKTANCREIKLPNNVIALPTPKNGDYIYMLFSACLICSRVVNDVIIIFRNYYAHAARTHAGNCRQIDRSLYNMKPLDCMCCQKPKVRHLFINFNNWHPPL